MLVWEQQVHSIVAMASSPTCVAVGPRMLLEMAVEAGQARDSWW